MTLDATQAFATLGAFLVTFTAAILGGMKGMLTRVEARTDAHFRLMDRRFEQIDARFTQVDDRFTQVDDRFNRLEVRMDRAERAIERADVRFCEFRDATDARWRQNDARLSSIDANLAALKDAVARLGRPGGPLLLVER